MTYSVSKSQVLSMECGQIKKKKREREREGGGGGRSPWGKYCVTGLPGNVSCGGISIHTFPTSPSNESYREK